MILFYIKANVILAYD